MKPDLAPGPPPTTRPGPGLGLGIPQVLALCLLGAGVCGVAIHTGVSQWPLPQLLQTVGSALGTEMSAPPPGSLRAWLWTVLLLLPLAVWLAQSLTGPWLSLLRALQGAVLSYQDGDFSTAIAVHGRSELAELTRLHNALGQVLREQRRHLAQRELLLDTVVQHTPLAMVLADAGGRVAYANLASRRLLHDGRSFEGEAFADVMAAAPAALREAVTAGQDALIAVPGQNADSGDDSIHLLVREVQLQGRPHRLYLLRSMTRELARQEVASWKRVIRVMSHELNNSLAPISSLAHTGAELARRGDTARLPGAFATIGERAAHLHAFVEGYARFARLPLPQPGAVDWAGFVDSLAAHQPLRQEGALPASPGWFDAGQMSQALINLLKNAHEAGGDPAEVVLSVASGPQGQRIEVADRGSGMSEAVLSQALLPFYSTKRSGTGLGLALAREIAEAHGGRIVLARREGGGSKVSLLLPPAPGGPSAPTALLQPAGSA